MSSDGANSETRDRTGSMGHPSRVPTSAQVEPHPKLEQCVRAHLSRPWQQPIHAHTQIAFQTVHDRIREHPKPIVLDSGCGTGWASIELAQRYPDHWVVGVDRSIDRLSRAPITPPNVCLVRAELGDFWRLVKQAAWPVTIHYVLYPNPYPKARHLKRRWHGHPAWPDLLTVGERLVMRTNARVYALEWAWALKISQQGAIDHRALDADAVRAEPLSAFEKKYAASGHALFEVTSQRDDLPSPTA